MTLYLPLLLTTLITGWVASIAGGIVGSYVVVKRIAFISGSIAHSVLGGLGLLLWLQRSYGSPLPPIYGALLVAVIAALLLAWVHLRYREREDSVIAAIWTIGMAAGILFLSFTPGYNTELLGYLLGNILWTSQADIFLIIVVDIIILALTFTLFNRFLLVCFDEDQARLQGISVGPLYILLLVLVALTVVLLIQVIGIILVLTLLTIPAALSNLFTVRLSSMMILAVILSAVFTTAGTLISFALDLPVGATIALLTGICYLLCLPIRRR